MKKFMSARIMLALLVVCASLAFAADSGGFVNLSTALSSLCNGIKTVIPIISFLLIIAAGAVYAGGQVLGAETRARASVWATAMLVGAFIGLIIILVAPVVINAMLPSYTTGVTSC